MAVDPSQNDESHAVFLSWRRRRRWFGPPLVVGLYRCILDDEWRLGARMRSPAAVAVNGPTTDAANSDLRHLSEPFGRRAGRTQSVAPAQRDVVD